MAIDKELKKLKGHMSIQRWSGQEDVMQLTFEDCSSGIRFMTAQTNPHDLMMALTGRGDVDVQIELIQSDCIGMVNQHRAFLIWVPDHDYSKRKEFCKKLIEETNTKLMMEPGGWQMSAREDDLNNSHKMVRVHNDEHAEDDGHWVHTHVYRYVAPETAAKLAKEVEKEEAAVLARIIQPPKTKRR